MHSSHEVCAAFSTSSALNHWLILLTRFKHHKSSQIITNHHNIISDAIWTTEKNSMQYEILYTTHRTCTCHRKFIDDSKHHENEILGLAKRWKINIPAISDLASMGKPTSHFPGDRGQATKMFQDRRSGFTKKSIRKAASRRRSSKRKTQLQNDDKAWQTFKASEFKSEVQVYFSTCIYSVTVYYVSSVDCTEFLLWRIKRNSRHRTSRICKVLCSSYNPTLNSHNLKPLRRSCTSIVGLVQVL